MWRKRDKGEGLPTSNLHSKSLLSEFRHLSIPPAEDRAFPEHNDCSGNALACHKDRSLTAPGCCSARHRDGPPSGDYNVL